MNPFKRFKKRFYDYIYDPEINVKDRTFVVFSVLYFLAVIGALIVGLFLHEPLLSTLISFGVIVFSILSLYIIVKKKIYKPAKILIAFVMVGFFQPSMFITKGGLDCGSLFTMLLGTYYLVLVLEGKFRIFMCILDAFVLGGLWTLAYIKPDIITSYTREADFIYSFAKYVMVVLVLTAIITYQTRIYIKESKIAEEKTKELEELNKSQSRFFSSMSHEIRTPINTVLGLNEVILRQEDASEEIKKDARNIQGAGKMLLALINDILDVSKIEAGKMDIVPVNYNVSSLLSEIVNMIWLKAEEKGLKFIVDIDPGVPEMLFGDEVRIKQILINMLNNAIKYTPEGSINLHMECDIPETGDALLKISISDTGMGIKPEALPHLFDTFQRVDEEKNRYIEGTGLGLSIVKQLVELMDGTITVNSVYGQGSVFTVAIKQGVSSEKRIGDISITNAGRVGANEKFEHIFHAPTARILIVDDNEMNLQVEKKLLDGTEITVDLAISGVEALAMTVRNHYDVIFMDHLMPEMDGLECYEKIREQSGGLNKNVPIIVLTANAGGENIDLYNNTGFDGYLVKPVSGKQLENMLINHLPPEKIIRNSDSEMTGSQMNTASGYSRKRAVAIGCSTMADIPAEIKEELQIASVPFSVITSEGVFDDNVDIDSDELVRYMEDKEKYVSSDAPSEEELTKFFASQLKFAHQLIYITLATGASVEYTRATNVAKSFENVTVVNSACLSTATGILAMIAGRLAKQNMPVEKIVAEIENAKTMVQCSFIIKSTDVMARRGNISSLANNVLNLFWLRPVIHVKNNKMGVARFFLGNEKKCYENYIKTTLSNVSKIDTTFAFVTSVGMTEEELLWIEKEIRDKVSFEHIIFQKASAGIASNCGAGTFGILYLNKGNVNYNLGTIFKYDELDEQSDEDLYDSDEEYETADKMIFESEKSDSDIKEETTAEKEWYEEIPGLDPKAGIKNSGSKDAFLSVLKIYYDSYDAKSGEIKSYYENEDWENYTIKVHALKSSSRLIGCLELGNNAEALEMAGKNNDIDFIRDNHDNLMNEYKTIRDELASEYGGVSDDLPDIPDYVLADAYGGLMEFAGAGDYELTRMILDSVKEYKLKDEDKEVFDKVNILLSNLDWDGIKETVQARM